MPLLVGDKGYYSYSEAAKVLGITLPELTTLLDGHFFDTRIIVTEVKGAGNHYHKQQQEWILATDVERLKAEADLEDKMKG